MARKPSLTRRVQRAVVELNQADRYGDSATVDLATAMLSKLQAQEHAVSEKAAEVGSLGLFSPAQPMSSSEVIERRQRSAVSVGDVFQLPSLGDAKRPSPNCLLRSAIFSVMKKGDRALLMRERVAAQGGYEVFFSGAQLDQADLDVWLHCLYLSRDNLGEQVQVGLTTFLTAIGRTQGAASQAWLRDSLVRLGMAVIQVKSEGVTVMVSDRMVVYEEREQISKSTISLRVSPTMAKLFGIAQWTALDLKVRTKLVGKPLAQWLHAYLATHKKPIPAAVATLRELSGSRTGELREFRRTLKQAVAHLVEAGFLKSWALTVDDKLQVTRS